MTERMLLLFNGLVHTLASDRPADWVVVDGGKVAATGPANDRPTAARSIDLEGMTLIPAFCDAHVHLPATGLYLTGLDFRGESSADSILRAFAARAGTGVEMVFGGNFEDPLDRPLSRIDLDTAVGDRPALLARADMHSCIVSSALLDRLDVGGEGVDVDEHGHPTGYLREKAAAAAWRWFDGNLPRPQARAAIEAAARRAYSKGVARVNEMHVVEWRGWAPLEVLLEVSQEMALDIKPYVATTDVDRVMELGLDCIGGDWFLDGSFGSHTAWLADPYDPPPPAGSPATGISYRSDDEVAEFFHRAQLARLQVGVHAIGDAAIEQAVRAWETVAANEGVDAVRALRHRIEHFECATDDHIARAGRLGLAASVQPAFDLYWGGPDGLYARRMGWDRARNMNRFRSMLAAGLILGAGSDSTVTPLDPFLQMSALMSHHLEAERLDARAALRAHTIGSNALGPGEATGKIEPGARGDLALLDRDPLGAGAGEIANIEVAGTWIGGARVWPPDEAETS